MLNFVLDPSGLASCVAIMSFSVVLGWKLVEILRVQSKISDKKRKEMSVSVFLFPIALFVILNILTVNGYFYRSYCNSVCVGIIIGILYGLDIPPEGANSVKLIVQQIDGPQQNVWISSMNLPLGEVRSLIGETLNVHPSSRIQIESGKGDILQEFEKPLSSLLSDSSVSIDFFGYTTASCYISIGSEDTSDDNDKSNTPNTKSSQSTFRLISRPDAKYGDLYTMSARIPDSTQDAFYISVVDKFAAANPVGQMMSLPHLRMITWSEESSLVDVASENGDSVISGTTNTSSDGKSKGWRKKLLPGIRHRSGQSIRNGDLVVLEHHGKFMSVARGWWMAWTSTSPRRSGAFVIEIVERASTASYFPNPLKGQLGSIKEIIRRPSFISLSNHGITQENISALSSGVVPPSTSLPNSPGAVSVPSTQPPKDDVLRPGDRFRLRSVKFPEYELGITNVKIRDDYCYLGLRKIGERNVNNEWCAEVTFVLKSTPLGTDIFKL